MTYIFVAAVAAGCAADETLDEGMMAGAKADQAEGLELEQVAPSGLLLADLAITECLDEYKEARTKGELHSATVRHGVVETDGATVFTREFSLSFGTGGHFPIFDTTETARLRIVETNTLPDGLLDHPGFFDYDCIVEIVE